MQRSLNKRTIRKVWYHRTGFEKRNIINHFKALLVLFKTQLKELEIYDVKNLKDAHFLTEFKALDSLHLNKNQAKDAKYIFQL